MAGEGFQFEGVKYEFRSLSLKEARDVQRATGFTPLTWEKQLSEADAEAITALVWIARRRNGETNLRFEDVDGDLATFRPYMDDADAEPVEGEPDFPGPGDNLTPSGPSAVEG